MTQFTTKLDYTSWGRVTRVPHAVAFPRFPDQVFPCLDQLGDEETLLPVGLRRSYGDSGLNGSGRLIDMTGLDRLIAFDRTSGVLRCDGGVSLDDLLRVIVPAGWFLPTTPGTRFVTIGGAIANDVHGKNHHRSGSLGCAVRSIGLLRTDGSPQRLFPGDPLFAATIGGMGLTGVILDAELALVPIRSAYLDVERVPFSNLSEFFGLAEDSVDHEHTVAWIDCANDGSALGRGIFQRANWCDDGALDPHDAGAGPVVPFDLPGFTFNKLTIRGFNALYYQLQKHGELLQRQHYAPFFYPLDSIRGWNRMYGARGLYQYQCVIPPVDAAAATEALIRLIAKVGAGSFLAVLKTLGKPQSGGFLSFPMEGATLALDFPNHGAETLHLLSQLDAIVLEAHGRLYPAKDGRMPARMFQAGYPEWQRFLPFKDPRMQSDFWQRVSRT